MAATDNITCITPDGLGLILDALTLPITGRLDTLPPASVTGVFEPLENGRGITMQVQVPRCTVLTVDVFDSSDPPLHVWTIRVDKFMVEGDILVATIAAG